MEDTIIICPSQQSNNTPRHHTQIKLLLKSSILKFNPPTGILKHYLVLRRTKVHWLALAQGATDIFQNIRFLAHILEKSANNNRKNTLLYVQDVIDEHR